MNAKEEKASEKWIVTKNKKNFKFEFYTYVLMGLRHKRLMGMKCF